MKLITSSDAREGLRKRGLSVASWAKLNGLKRHTVADVLNGKSQGLYGQAHKAAVLLGIKDGVIDQKNDEEYLPVEKKAKK